MLPVDRFPQFASAVSAAYEGGPPGNLETFEGNWFARSDYIADATPPAYKGLPVYADNIRIGATQVQRPHLDRSRNRNSTVTARRTSRDGGAAFMVLIMLLCIVRLM